MNFKIMTKGAIALLTNRFAGPFWFRRRQLAKTQWWSEQELKSLQLKLLKRLVSHAYNTVPYYRKLMDERFFVYGEETDWSYRFKKMAGRLCSLPTAR
jgi:hypothetical protein